MDEKKRPRSRGLLAGTAAGLINGLFGGGGGMLLLPLLRDGCGLEEKRAFATCVAVIVPVSAVSAALYLWRGAVDLPSAWPYLLGGLLGGLAAGRTLDRVPVGVLRKLFALLLIWGGVKSWL